MSNKTASICGSGLKIMKTPGNNLFGMNVKTILFLIMIVLLGASLRFQAIGNTVVDQPVRADARIYYFTALNLKYWGVFSQAFPSRVAPEPGAFAPPALPYALVPFAEFPPTERMLFRFNSYQALLSTLTILSAYTLFRLLAGSAVALGAALLTALAPHLVVMTTYLLTETQFTFLLTSGMLALALGMRRTNPGWAILGGFLLGLSALTRSTTEYFPVFMAPFLFWTMGTRSFLRIGLPAIGAALIMIVAWKIRNLAAIGATSDPTLLINTILHGMYPDFMFNGIPESFGFPYRFDPFAAQPHTAGEVLQELSNRVREAPWTFAYWYLIGKPATLLSWNIIAGMGGIFVYPVEASPYLTLPFFQITESVSAYLHSPLTIAALAGCGVVLFRPRILGLNENNRHIAVLIVALILYFLAVHMMGAPFPRYGIPLRPIIYGFGLFTLVALGKKIPLYLTSLRKKAEIHG
ncbi:MAG: glycosyltransferase family 39 protein [Azoarcus sp.]|jgi:4-amino-4-deoxy-L-arabinose transferase-like glycosyltransferase|nr:glycosyltransferase family 39 protein [Azoarcus sp.]